MRYKITFFNRKTKKREVYLNNTTFPELSKATEEVERLIKRENELPKPFQSRVRFRIEKVEPKKEINNENSKI